MRISRRIEDEKNRRYPWKEGRIQFFKIILPSCIRDRKLDLPSKFVRKLGNSLADVAILKVPTNQVWKVELKKSDKSIWFCNGWQEFAEYHSICAWHFLVFKYIGSSSFDVLIFDMSGAEILYPCDVHDVEDSNSEGECSMHHGNKEIEENDVHETCTDQEVSIQMRIQKISWVSMTASVKQKAQKSLETVQAFKSKYPFFMLVMYSTYIDRDLASVNKKFADRYLPGKKGTVSLAVSGGRTWNVKYLSSTNTSLTNGWNRFARENELKVGDICVFELVNRNDLLLKVSILRNGNIVHNGEDPADSRECPMPGKEEIKGDDDYVLPSDGHETCRIQDESVQLQRATVHPCSRSIMSSSKQQNLLREIEAAQTFKSKYPSYMLVISSYFLFQDYATVKAGFSTRYLPDKKLGSLTLMVSDGRKWHVSYSSRRNNTNTALTKGWINFVRENELKEGDICVFELINRDNLLLKVSIFQNAKKRDRRIADDAEDPNSGRQCPLPLKNEINEDEAPRAHREQKAIQAAEAFKSINPSYICVMCSAYVHRYFMWVPQYFARIYLSKHKFGSLILTVPDGRTWSVKYISRREHGKTSLSRGWATFVKDNGLVEGDVCVFELIDRKNLMLKVFIFRDARKCSAPRQTEIQMRTPKQEESDGMQTVQ